MNPSHIGTPVAKVIDQWHFWLHMGKRHQIAFDIEMRRARDIESDEMNWRFSAYLAKPERYANNDDALAAFGVARDHIQAKVIATAPSMPELKAKLLELLRVRDAGSWHKVIGIAAGRNEYHRIVFEWGIGLRSACGKYYRALDSTYACDGTHVFIKGGSNAVCHPYTPELEEVCKDIERRTAVLADRLGELVKKPDQLLALTANLLPAPTTSTPTGKNDGKEK